MSSDNSTYKCVISLPRCVGILSFLAARPLVNTTRPRATSLRRLAMPQVSNHGKSLERHEEHAAGEAEYKAAQAHEYVEGATDRMHGKGEAVWGAMTGDKTQQAKGNLRHDKGEAQQEINKP
ncbi:hypothetical protein MIND_01393000 [Mycena indigotica]|uniref:Uncharacterized protein n=1 Tax=Mycena indigotica TaxID=2126181 RepID=A0A8H6RYI5_9AGAR|nr:uncharacterized protein MIND_01393000 [Mycena indigotica]KAF7289311.1 hypothetical protein MIND_01393000 [Mycena indigotica]